ncbi:MAG: symmetrical bis(5'-nucleosyl)-tetraphosphatase [Gammaproteobacteria bacterium]|nr:symmetrical bis(5'-nucleosyl)-tetraphosphatase [Gammaproteobacteria bacterium]NNF50292.1 symmetrical bis(5'-nucleosyl)-tetraphosphatase [Woeseiaceae bacterium]MBT8095046.1 symmetrical bis(5'-nucleosyl)-tetraphosphatase [Gammaproteobacteria bacterium]MBT8105585.1 symmetrical bis(5'-nucleosyl)-tetraphosphatase [Gammaproteobacteria bacterium]NNK25599.1 symmetrical bis(5'-nucleosyl)-tetraphosphatase [Woeseiaceae bacterium]
MAVYAIGDIQGCYDPFRRLLDTIRFDPDRDTLWLVGDLVNRGPKSLKTLRFVRDLGDSVVTVLGNHDLHLLALQSGAIPRGNRFRTLRKLLAAPDADELCDWLRHRPLVHYDKKLDTLLVHAGIHPSWSIKKALKRAAEVEAALQADGYRELLAKMYGNTPACWSGSLVGYKRLRFIINCFTRMRMLTGNECLELKFSGSPFRARKSLTPWYQAESPAWGATRIVFGHWSALGLLVLPNLVSLDTGCVWGRQLTAVRVDKRLPRVVQVEGQE